MIDYETPRDGETLAGYVYNAQHGLWVYPAGYSDGALCARRAEHLTQAHRVFFDIRQIGAGEDWYAVTGVAHTAALRASLRPLPQVDPVTLAPMALAWEDSDTEAHVRETVDELRREV